MATKEVQHGKIIETPLNGRCPNCDANMKIAVYVLDITKAALVVEMGRAVHRRIKEGMEFTIANQIHVPSLQTSDGVRHETTHCAKLGLIAKVIGMNGRQVSGFWLITKRGFSFLRGEAVPKKVAVWRGRIQERHDEIITLREAAHLHEERVKELHARNKEPKVDLRKTFESHDPSAWVEYGGVHEGKLF